MKGWLDSPIESFKETYRQLIDKWQAAMDALDAAYGEFRGNYDYAQQDAELASKWAELDGKVSLLETTVQGASDAIDGMKNFFSSVGSSIGLSGREMTMKGMGILPAVPWALVGIVTAGIAGIWLVINALRAFNIDVTNRKIAEQNIINSQEGKPSIPYLDLSDSSVGGVFSALPDTAKWAAIGVIGFLLIRAFDHGNR